MKLNPEFLIQHIGDNAILVPVGNAGQKFHGIVQLNSTAAFIVGCLTKETDETNIKTALANEYNGTDEDFTASINDTLAKLRECGALIE